MTNQKPFTFDADKLPSNETQVEIIEWDDILGIFL